MATFSEHIREDKLTLVDFSATWCGPCKAMEPVLQQLKADLGEAVRILKIDIDKSPAAARAYQVQAVPTLLLFRKGSLLWRQSGAVDISFLKQKLASFR